MGPGHSSSLRIGDDSSVAAGSGRTGGASYRLTKVALRHAPREPPFPLDKGKGRIDEIKYPEGLKYLKSAMQNALVVGPSKVEPLYGATFAKRYRPPFGVRVWSPYVFTSYVVHVPKMVCFFEVAFDNDLHFPLHPFIKGVLQHFNVCPSQLSPNFWGILVGLMVFFRDKGFGVPSIALFLYLFSAKESAEGFLYLSRRASAPLVIFDLPSSHRLWKERYFFISDRNWEYDPLDKDDTLGVPVAWTTPENLREYRFVFGIVFVSLLDISNSALTVCFSGIRLDLSSEDKVVKQELDKCPPCTYSELIRSDVPGPSRLRSSRSAALRPSPPSAMKFSPVDPFVTKPTKGELLARVETLSRKSRGVKRKSLDSVDKDHPAWGKFPKLGASSSSPSAHVQVPGQVLPPSVKVPKALSSQPRSGSAVKVKDSSGRAAEPPLEVMPITVWSPPAQSVEPPSSRAEELKRKGSEDNGDGDSLLLNAELAAGAVLSILIDSDLKRSGALPIEEVLALSLQGVAFVSSNIFQCLILT